MIQVAVKLRRDYAPYSSNIIQSSMAAVVSVELWIEILEGFKTHHRNFFSLPAFDFENPFPFAKTHFVLLCSEAVTTDNLKTHKISRA